MIFELFLGICTRNLPCVVKFYAYGLSKDRYPQQGNPLKHKYINMSKILLYFAFELNDKTVYKNKCESSITNKMNRGNIANLNSD